LQAFAVLLRAEAEAGCRIPPRILHAMTRHLIACADRPWSFTNESLELSYGPFRSYTGDLIIGDETVPLHWYPWAILACHSWIARSRRFPARAEDVTRIRRSLGHLVVDLQSDILRVSLSRWTAGASSHLMGLSSL
jgi:hypothetical protein